MTDNNTIDTTTIPNNIVNDSEIEPPKIGHHRNKKLKTSDQSPKPLVLKSEEEKEIKNQLNAIRVTKIIACAFSNYQFFEFLNKISSSLDKKAITHTIAENSNEVYKILDKIKPNLLSSIKRSITTYQKYIKPNIDKEKYASEDDTDSP